MQLTDIGANLAHDSFDRDRGEVLARAQESGISRIIITGSNAQSNGIALSLAKTHPEFLYSTAGLHPHYANEYDQQLHESIHTMLIEPEVVAVGECGLDYFRNFSPKAAQRKAFEKQLDLAEESDLPIFLHQRDAHEDFVEILKIAVSKSFRKIGIAKKLIKEVELFISNSNTSKIFLEVREGNEAAISLYKELGFKIDGIRKNYYKKYNENALLMSKELS